MELLLFPTMTKMASLESFTTFFIASYECATLPILTKLGVISKKIRFSPKILKVMRIYTLCFVMLMVIWAPFSFEVKYVKVEILILRQKMMNKSDFNVFNRVSE
jgi:hypothetical protein